MYRRPGSWPLLELLWGPVPGAAVRIDDAPTMIAVSNQLFVCGSDTQRQPGWVVPSFSHAAPDPRASCLVSDPRSFDQNRVERWPAGC